MGGHEPEPGSETEKQLLSLMTERIETIKLGIQAMQEGELCFQEFTSNTCTDDLRLVNPDVGELRGLKACVNYSLVLFQTLPGFKLQVLMSTFAVMLRHHATTVISNVLALFRLVELSLRKGERSQARCVYDRHVYLFPHNLHSTIGVRTIVSQTLPTCMKQTGEGGAGIDCHTW